MADQCTRPVGLATSTDVDVLVVDGSACAIRTPAPDITVGAVGGRLACIEGTAVEHALMTILRPVGTWIVETSF